MTLAEDVAHKLGWIKREDGYWAYVDLDRAFSVRFAWKPWSYEVSTFCPDIKPGHTAYVKRDIEGRGLYWTCVSPRCHGGHFSFTITGPESNICVLAETEEIACCLAFSKHIEVSIPETKGENNEHG